MLHRRFGVGQRIARRTAQTARPFPFFRPKER